MRVYDLYGIEMGSLDEVAIQVSRLLGIEFEERESDFIGGLYYRAKLVEGGTMRLQYNYNEQYEAFQVTKFPEFPILLYIDDTPQYEVYQDKLLSTLPCKIVFLQRGTST